MKLYLYIDESGSVHKNSKTKYFAVGGYYTFSKYNRYIYLEYKKIINNMKYAKKCDANKELKSYNFNKNEKKLIFSKINKFIGFFPCVKIFDKSLMNKKVTNVNLFFNYCIKVYIQDIIFKTVKCEKLIFYIYIDERNLSLKDINNLSIYLGSQFKNCIFFIKYCKSECNYGIQLADLIVNTVYNSYKNVNIVSNIVNDIYKYPVSSFPHTKKYSQVMYTNIDLKEDM